MGRHVVFMAGALAVAIAFPSSVGAQSGSQPITKTYPPYERRGGDAIGDPFSSSTIPADGAQIVWPEDPEKCRAEALKRQFKQRYEEAKATRKQPTTPLVIPPECDPARQLRSEPAITKPSLSDAELERMRRAAAAEEARRAVQRAAQIAAEKKRRMQELWRLVDVVQGGALERFINGGTQGP